jgi:heme/copper-type cytochrome/quinol oxidase subunit 2
VSLRDATVGLAVAALTTALLAACGSGDPGGAASGPTTAASSAGSSASASMSSSPPASPEPAVVDVAVTVRGGRVTPPTHRVKVRRGQTVRLRVTSDVADEVHVHGFDLKKDVGAGQTATIEFVADQPGLDEVELESAGLQLVQLEIR